MLLRTFLFFSVVGLDKPGGISPFVSTACGFVSAEVNEADSSGRGSGDAPSPSFYVIRQKVPPNIPQVRPVKRENHSAVIHMLRIWKVCEQFTQV